MLRTSVGAAVLILLVCFTVAAQDDQNAGRYAQRGQQFYNFDFVGGGARAQGMGNAYLGLSDGVTAGAWNPAGLTAHESPMLGASYGSLMARGTVTTTIGTGAGRSFGRDNDGSISEISSLNFIAPLRVKGKLLVGSINYTANFGTSLELGYETEAQEYFWVPDGNLIIYRAFPVEVRSDQSFEGGVKAVTFSLGTRFYKSIDIGLGVNVYTGQSVGENTITSNVYNLPIQPGGQLVTGSRVIYSVDSNKYSGVNFVVGFKHNGDKLDAGLVIRTPFALRVKTGSSTYNTQLVNGMVTEDNTDTVFVDNQLIKYELPLMVGFGIAYKMSEKTTLATDLEYRGFGSANIKYRDSIFIDPAGNNEEYFTEQDLGWKNVILARLGVEHMLDSRYGAIPLRAGVSYVPSPVAKRAPYGGGLGWYGYSLEPDLPGLGLHLFDRGSRVRRSD